MGVATARPEAGRPRLTPRHRCTCAPRTFVLVLKRRRYREHLGASEARPHLRYQNAGLRSNPLEGRPNADARCTRDDDRTAHVPTSDTGRRPERPRQEWIAPRYRGVLVRPVAPPRRAAGHHPRAALLLGCRQGLDRRSEGHHPAASISRGYRVWPFAPESSRKRRRLAPMLVRR